MQSRQRSKSVATPIGELQIGSLIEIKSRIVLPQGERVNTAAIAYLNPLVKVQLLQVGTTYNSQVRIQHGWVRGWISLVSRTGRHLVEPVQGGNNHSSGQQCERADGSSAEGIDRPPQAANTVEVTVPEVVDMADHLPQTQVVDVPIAPVRKRQRGRRRTSVAKGLRGAPGTVVGVIRTAAALHGLCEYPWAVSTDVALGSETKVKASNGWVHTCFYLFCRLLAFWSNLESLCNLHALYNSGSYHKGTMVPMHPERMEAKSWYLSSERLLQEVQDVHPHLVSNDLVAFSRVGDVVHGWVSRPNSTHCGQTAADSAQVTVQPTLYPSPQVQRGSSARQWKHPTHLMPGPVAKTNGIRHLEYGMAQGTNMKYGLYVKDGQELSQSRGVPSVEVECGSGISVSDVAREGRRPITVTDKAKKLTGSWRPVMSVCFINEECCRQRRGPTKGRGLLGGPETSRAYQCTVWCGDCAPLQAAVLLLKWLGPSPACLPSQLGLWMECLRVSSRQSTSSGTSTQETSLPATASTVEKNNGKLVRWRVPGVVVSPCRAMATFPSVPVMLRLRGQIRILRLLPREALGHTSSFTVKHVGSRRGAVSAVKVANLGQKLLAIAGRIAILHYWEGKYRMP